MPYISAPRLWKSPGAARVKKGFAPCRPGGRRRECKFSISRASPSKHEKRKPFIKSHFYVRVNGRIRAPEVRVVDAEGKQLGILPIREAIQAAQKRGLDLVEVAANAKPPVCKIIDYGKYRYQEGKHQREARRHSVASKVKELKFHVNIAAHDFATKINHAIEFLTHGNKVKIVMVFRGREMTHTDIGREILKQIIAELTPFGQVEMEPKMIRNLMTMMVGPLPSSKRVAATKKAHSEPAVASPDHLDPAKVALSRVAPKPALGSPAPPPSSQPLNSKLSDELEKIKPQEQTAG